MIRLVFILIFGVLIVHSHAQKLGVYREGTVFFKKGDSLTGYIFIDPSITDQISFRKTHQDEANNISAKKIRCIVTKQRYIENIQDGKKEHLMHLVVAGKDSLFQYVSTEEVIKKRTIDGHMVGANFNMVYWHKRNNTFTKLDENYSSVLAILLADCKALEEKLKTNFAYQEVPSIVETYNKCVQ